VNTYEVVVLRSTGKSRDDDGYAVAKAGHLAYVEQQRRSGHVRLYGAVGAPLDAEFTSVFLYRVGSQQEAKRIAEQDPLVEQGYITVDVSDFVTGWTG
jgi:uncharacterized protein YciI